MSFQENLSNLRKEKGLSQEGLAELLEVSRQTVYKWETGQSTPELDRLVMLSKIFGCSIDDLVKKEVNTADIQLRDKYERFYNRFAFFIAFGVFLIIAGVAALVLLIDLMDGFLLGVGAFFVSLIAAVVLFILFGIQEEEMRKQIPADAKFYNDEEVRKFSRRFAIAIASCVGLILLAVITVIVLYEYFQDADTWPAAIMLFMIAVAVFGFVYFGILDSKYLMDNRPKQENKTASMISGIIMLIATMIFLYLGFVENIWHPSWVVFVIGGLLCGIVSQIFQYVDQKKKN